MGENCCKNQKGACSNGAAEEERDELFYTNQNKSNYNISFFFLPNSEIDTSYKR